jgi:DNA-binding MarR family transcriptional regulator
VNYHHYMSRSTDALDKVRALSTRVAQDLERCQTAERMTTPRVHLLWQLGAAGPSTQRDLADALDVSPRNITGLVDGLVASGHVTREPHPTDRRATLVTPTEAGTAFVAELRRSRDQLAHELFGDLGAEQLSSFVDTLDETLTRFDRLVEEQSA